MLSDREKNQHNNAFGILPAELIRNIFNFFTPDDMKKISTVSKSFCFFSNDNNVWRLSLKNKFGINCNAEMNLKKFTHALKEQTNILWETYNHEFLITPFPPDVSLFLKELFENPSDIYEKYVTLNLGGLPYAIELASARGYEEMVIYLITKGHLVPLVEANSLSLAIQGGYFEITKHLIDSGVDVTGCYYIKETRFYEKGAITLKNVPLHNDNFHSMCHLAYAIKYDQVAIAKLLLDSGASFDNLSFVHPVDKNFNKENHRTVTQLMNEKRLSLSDNMKLMIEERKNLNQYISYSMGNRP